MPNRDHQLVLPPILRASARRIQDAWDRVTTTSLLGMLWLAAAEAPIAENTLSAPAFAQEPHHDAAIIKAKHDGPDASRNVSADELAQSDHPRAAASDSDTGHDDSKADEAKQAIAEEGESSGDAHGSSTSLQLIETRIAEALKGFQDAFAKESTLSIAEAKPGTEDQVAGIRVNGSDGNDIIVGTAAADVLNGGAGDDHLHGGGGNDTLRGGEGNDFLSGGSGDDSLQGNAGDDELLGGTGNDDLQGGSGNDTLSGGGNADNLEGEAGADLLHGDDGDDVLVGGQGADQLTGGEGADCFKFNWVEDSDDTPEGRDHILDFRQGLDKIDLVRIDANDEASDDQSFQFVGLSDFGRAHGQLRFGHFRGSNADEDRTLVEADTDGDGHANMQIELHGFFTMTIDDFLL